MKKTMGRRLLVSIACIVMSETTAFAAGEQRGLDELLAPTPGGGLTSDQVAARAQQMSFDAAAQREAIESAEARVEQARSSYLPKLTLTGRYTRLSPITQSFPLPGGNTGMMMGAWRRPRRTSISPCASTYSSCRQGSTSRF